MKTFVSSSCRKHQFIGDTVRELLGAGVRHIELSGGTSPYRNLMSDLKSFRELDGVQFLVHNYFPPPLRPFVINLASVDPSLRAASLRLAKEAVRVASALGVKEYGIHSGFRFDIGCEEIGADLSQAQLVESEHAECLFRSSVEELVSFATEFDVSIYIENNVLSHRNRCVLGPSPFLGLLSEDLIPLLQTIRCGLILDMAHLFVTCQSLDVNFEDEVAKLSPMSDYIHISENKGYEDENAVLCRSSRIVKAIGKISRAPRYVTIESYGSVADVLESSAVAREAFHQRWSG